jgi:predicted 2-oxoglutarate/Fe(II)-dependent dioxygenase YbiX
VLNELFFRTMGFYVQPRFLSAQECTQLRQEAAASQLEEASVVRGPDIVIDRDHRRTKRAALRAQTEASLLKRFDEVRPRIGSHFGQQLEAMQPLQLLMYEAGDFFALHTDAKHRPELPQFLQQRRVSLVLFLGHEGVDGAGSHGGLLQFHELLDEPRMQNRAYPFDPQLGTLLAFPSSVLHEVTTVQAGVRYSLVTWLY